MKYFLGFLIGLLALFVHAQSVDDLIDQYSAEVEKQVIEWRRHLHQYPELSNREYNTSKYIQQQLDKIGIPYIKDVAFTGVVATLKGGKPGPTIGLRADIDGLPVVEQTELPFASKEKTTYLDKEVGIMHACGHDSHVAILLGTASVLKKLQKEVPGTVIFVFQPAEEGAPEGEEGGAELMVKEGVISKNGIEAMFGLHISSQTPANTIRYKVGGAMAASDRLEITVKGKQTHGARPWAGVDPVTVSAQIILGLQNIISRQTNISKEAAVISIGKIEGGVRNNIIPNEVKMIGTIRTLDTEMQKEIHQRIENTAKHIAESAGATADVDIKIGYPVTYNDPALTRRMLPTLFKTAGENNVIVSPAATGAEDFSFFAREVPGLFFWLGGMDPSKKAVEVAPHHTPKFYLHEEGFILGVRTFCNLVFDYASTDAQ